MGVPKFYRWISERYPCLSEVIKNYQIPEFDNLYLDMNGIIHICSHPNDDDPHFRITEKDIFKDIFHYIEVLFRMIQPRKVFYMAVDGVAPRAKMNQQRGRRFRSAKTAEDNEQKALAKGEVLPTEQRFDSNCITPGTPFMERLDKQLQYFVSSKISSDKLWSDCSVIYSGHQTPGEGEHKIMEYIRYARSQPNYDSNTRHCLYGLDADLLMLGLTSHEPHFSLLREEVRFGSKNATKRTPTPEETTFHLLHLSLMREYLDYEFYDLRKSLKSEYDIEKIIDDWVLMGFLVGNDFIPNLPGLHINKGALPVLYKKYIEVRPSMNGYLNEGGYLNLKRFEMFMNSLSTIDVESFEELSADIKYLKGKRSNITEKKFESVSDRVERMKKFDFEADSEEGFGALEDETSLSNEEIRNKFLKLNLTDCDELMYDDDDEDESQFEAEFRQHKRHYYMEKIGYSEVTPDVLREQATNYVRALQWNLHYYYNGICSWSWYYPYHYAPYISDIKDFQNISLQFDLAVPFLPFEQLLAVLPPLSAALLPEAYRDLMLKESSPLIDFYPKNFETDLNGKLQEWEAVVLIPFICEKRLIEAMLPHFKLLSNDEKSRNTQAPILIYRYTSTNLGEYEALDHFPKIIVNHAAVSHIHRSEWDVMREALVKGRLPNVKENLYFAGFPTLKHINHEITREQGKVKVFNQVTRGESIILKLDDRTLFNIDGDSAEQFIDLLGKEVYVNYPHLIAAKVVSVMSRKDRVSARKTKDKTLNSVVEQLDKHDIDYFETEDEDLRRAYANRWGIEIGHTNFILYVRTLSGRAYIPTSDGRITLEKVWTDINQAFPLQTVVKDISVYDPNFSQFKTVSEYFTQGSKVFMLGHPNYGHIAEVIPDDESCRGRVRIHMVAPQSQVDFQRLMSTQEEEYMSSYTCSTKLGITPHLFARITGSILLLQAKKLNPFVERDGNASNSRLNIGLDLKSNKKCEETLGFTRKCMDTNQWLYSDECVTTILDYMNTFSDVFQYLNNNTHANEVFADDIFPNNYETRVPELRKYLKECSFSKAERCKWGTKILSLSVASEIIDEVEKWKQLPSKNVKMQVKPHLLYKPNPLQGSTPVDSSLTFRLFDRVINVREGFSVPLGLMGTVVGIHPAEKDCDKLFIILFDKEFVGGITHIGPKSANRCYKMNCASMLNISRGNKGATKNTIAFNITRYEKKLSAQNMTNTSKPTFGARDSISTKVDEVTTNSYQITKAKLSKLPCVPKNCYELTQRNEVACLVHGDYYKNWARIRESGLSIDDSRFIQCVSYVPPRMVFNSFEIHVYLSVDKLLFDDISVFLMPNGEALCLPPNANILEIKYIEKVVDAETGKVIFRPEEKIKPTPDLLKGKKLVHEENIKTNIGPSFVKQSPNNTSRNVSGVGRGRMSGSYQDPKNYVFDVFRSQKKPMNVFNGIQSQFETVSPLTSSRFNRNLGSDDAAKSRREVSVSELFQSVKPTSNYNLLPKNSTPKQNAVIPNTNPFAGYPNYYAPERWSSSYRHTGTTQNNQNYPQHGDSAYATLTSFYPLQPRKPIFKGPNANASNKSQEIISKRTPNQLMNENQNESSNSSANNTSNKYMKAEVKMTAQKQPEKKTEKYRRPRCRIAANFSANM